MNQKSTYHGNSQVMRERAYAIAEEYVVECVSSVLSMTYCITVHAEGSSARFEVPFDCDTDKIGESINLYRANLEDISRTRELLELP